MSKKSKEDDGGRQDVDAGESNPVDKESQDHPMNDGNGMERLKNWLLSDEGSAESWIDDEADVIARSRHGSSFPAEGDGVGVSPISDSVLTELEELRKENSDLRSRLEEGIGNLPSDQASILRKEMELMELEERLRDREKKMDRPVFTGTDKELEERFQEELREKEEDFKRRQTEFKLRIEQMENELKEKELENRMKEEELRLSRMNNPEVEKEFEEKYKELQAKEKSMSRMEREVENLKAEVVQKDEELKKLNELFKFKDKEFGQRDEDLLYRERKLEEERRRFEEAKKETSGLKELEMKKRLETLKEEIQAKEDEIRNKEKFLKAKENELRRREQHVIEDEIDSREEERALEVQQAKVKTGNRRLDDLLLGGIPFGSNVLVHGPPFTGKEVMIGQFVTEGLIKGIPCIWIVTDKSPGDIREEMRYIISGYEEYEKLGLVKYVDTYSMSMGQATEDPYTIFLNDPSDHNSIMENVENIVKDLKQQGHEHYRLAFRSLSTLIAYSDPISTFRFMSPFCGKRKRDKAVSMYAMEKGMHSDQEIQMIGSVMDGMIDFKVDQLKTFFAIKGITETQSRSYIRYTATKSALSIGSFSLDHIR